MDDYLKRMILVYFKHHKSYSQLDISKWLGISIDKTDNLMDELITEQKIEYIDNVLRLTLVGRTALHSFPEDYIEFANKRPNIPSINAERGLPLDAVYLPEKFLAKLK